MFIKHGYNHILHGAEHEKVWHTKSSWKQTHDLVNVVLPPTVYKNVNTGIDLTITIIIGNN